MTRNVSRHHNAYVCMVAALGILVSLAACGKGTELASPGQSLTTPSPLRGVQENAPAAASPVDSRASIGDVTWTMAIASATRAPVDSVTRYFTDAPSFIAVMPVADLPTDTEVQALWSYNSTSLDDFATRLVVNEGPGNHWITFRLDRSPDVSWPPGVYEVAVSIDGVLVREASVEVIDPQ